MKHANGTNVNFLEWLGRTQYEEDWEPEPCCEPTYTAAGSVERIEVCRMRVELGLEIWHPDDALEIIPPPLLPRLERRELRPMRVVDTQHLFPGGVPTGDW